MKKVLPPLFVLFIFGCHHQTNDQNLLPGDQVLTYGAKFDKLLLGVESSNSQLTLSQELKLENQSITLPVGTVLQKVKDNPNTLTYTLPDGYKAIGQTSDGKAKIAAGGSVTCSCTQGRECSPYIASLGKNQSIGCAATGNCTKCNMSVNGARLGATDEAFSTTEIINFNNPVHFVTSKAELATLISPSHTLMELEEVRKQIVDFAGGYQVDDLEALNKSTGPDDLPTSYSYLHVNVYGRLIMLPVQTSLTLSANPLVNEILRENSRAGARAAATVYKCSCNAGRKGCIMNSGSVLLAKAVYCDAGECTSCTLSWI
jgi:hypothetical protein